MPRVYQTEVWQLQLPDAWEVRDEAPEGGYWVICPEVPGANGQGETVEEAKESLRGAIRLVLEDRLEDPL